MKTQDVRDLMIVILVVFIILALLSIRIVKPGTVRVVTVYGRVTGRVLQPGLNFITPVVSGTIKYNTKKVIYEATTKDKQKDSRANYKDSFVDTNTKDGQQVDVFYTIRFSVDPDKACWVAQHIGNEKDLVEKVVKTESRIWVRNIARDYTADELYTGNVVDVQNRIYDQLLTTFADNGLRLDSVGIREIKFTDEYIESIEQKQIEAVKVETQKNIAAQARYKKEAQITEAEGQAKAQELLRASLTDEIVKKMWIEKWNGEMPKVFGGGNLIDVSTFVK